MSEATQQARIAAALAPLFHDGSVIVNDFRTPQVASRQRAPWAVLALADEVSAVPGESWTTPEITYAVAVTLVDYVNGRDDKTALDGFQSLRQGVLAALLAAAPPVVSIETETAVGPYFAEDGEPDPDSIAQRLVVNVVEYEV